MQKIRKIIILLLALSMLTFNSRVLADDDLEEDLGTNEIDDIIKSVTAETSETPVINSRHAVIYDRASRKSFVWKKRKRKMQNGFND